MRTRGRTSGFITSLALGLLALVLGFVVLFGRPGASEASNDCQFGAISAVGPVDAQGRGDTTPEVSCLEP